ncbi:hypothetical protein ABT001_31875 [Streptomyces sp. NPDC002793]|uniref:hypothetical protein n=1 Tax=Streptomyces sp. NPDC002793 TaxID=3154432 RepID=UPI003327BC5D
MGDGTTVTCHGPGTPYAKSRGGHLYERPFSEQPGGRFKGTATAHWTVTWTAPALGDGGQFTETRATGFTADVREVQVLN